MPDKSTRLSRFWKEFRRRNVLRSLAIYAGTAFIILEATTIIFPRWSFPDWAIDLVLWLLILGAFINVIIAWFYDITPGGMQRTLPLEEVFDQEKTPSSRGWKAATYISVVVIVGLIILNIAGGPKQLRAGDIQSIVILPFDNFTGDDELDYFVAGMHASLINDLGKLSGLRVICKTSASAFQDMDLTASEIARELNVDAVVEGSIMCLDDSICSQFRLVNTSGEEKQIWTADYKEDKSQILNLYNRITKKIAAEVKIELTAQEIGLFEKDRTVDKEAFDAYLRSQQYWGDFSLESFNKTRDYLNSAIEKDPDWAPLYLGLANYWMSLAQWGHEMHSVALPIAIENLNRALELDPDLPDAHHLIGWIAFVSEWDWAKAEREFLKALTINPNDALSRVWYAHLLCVLQRQGEAIPQAQLALEMDPLNPLVRILYSTTQLMVYWCEADRTQIEELLAADPSNYGANVILNYLSSYCEEYETAIMTERILLQRNLPGQFDDKAWKEIETIYKEKGYHAAYEKIVPICEDLYSPNTFPMELAIVYAKANQYNRVMDMIEKGYEIRDHTMPYLTTAYDFEPLYDNPRFLAILEKVNLSLPKSN